MWVPAWWGIGAVGQAQIDIEDGHSAAAVEALQEALALCSRYELASILPEIHRTMAQARLLVGQPLEAETSASALEEPASRYGAVQKD